MSRCHRKQCLDTPSDPNTLGSERPHNSVVSFRRSMRHTLDLRCDCKGRTPLRAGAASAADQIEARNRAECGHSPGSKRQTAQEHFRDAVTQLCLRTVSLALCVPLEHLAAANRCKADIALARQVAMYLAHTQFSLAMTEIGLAMGRDRTTVSHACNLVEDRRDDDDFDLMLTQLEDLLSQAVRAIEAKEAGLAQEAEVVRVGAEG
ncbi:MAG: helix-turn-helix domain-containing protein [Pseudomonadota bacterium]